MFPGSHMQVSLGLFLGVRLVGYKVHISETLLDNSYFLQKLTNLHSHQLWLKISVAHIVTCHFCHSHKLVFIKPSDVLTYITLLSNRRWDSVSIQTLHLDLCPRFEVRGPCQIGTWPHLGIYQKAGLKKENNSAVFSIKCWLTNVMKKSWC